MNRRLFLRGLGGACVAAPFLSSLGARSVKAQAAALPKRLIIMYTHYGCITTRWFPTLSHGPLTTADLASTTLQYLAPYVDKLLMPRGIRAMNEWTQNMVRGQGNDQHTQVSGTYFTCQPVTPNSDNPFSFTESTKFDAVPVGPSLDHVIAQQLSPGGTPLLMRVGNLNDSAQSAISYSSAQNPFPGLGSTSDIFASLTGLFQSGTPMSPDTYRVFRGKSAVDIFRDDLDTLERADLSQSDKNKLEAWKALLDQTTSVMRAAQCDQDLATTLGLTPANLAVESMPAGLSDPLTTAITDSMDGADLYSNLAVLAAACNANPVIVLKYPAAYIFKGLGINTDSESVSFRTGSEGGVKGSCEPDAIEQILTIDDYYAKKFATLVGQLDAIEEGDVTLLDNSATVWFQQFSDGSACNLNNLPILQAGGCGGYFKTGWAVNVEDGSPNLTSGNSEVFCGDSGSDMADSYSQASGTDPNLANAPINKYYCSLMNALGVKAGTDGFPAKGGSSAVSKFGMYDRTADFIHGGTNPALISDPGEFTALKANG